MTFQIFSMNEAQSFAPEELKDKIRGSEGTQSILRDDQEHILDISSDETC